MTTAKIYEVEGFRFGFTQMGDPLKGILVTRFPELEPYTAEVNLTKPSSCEGYARRAAKLHGMSQKGLESPQHPVLQEVRGGRGGRRGRE
jgi:hypothetical protein